MDVKFWGCTQPTTHGALTPLFTLTLVSRSLEGACPDGRGVWFWERGRERYQLHTWNCLGGGHRALGTEAPPRGRKAGQCDGLT